MAKLFKLDPEIVLSEKRHCGYYVVGRRTIAPSGPRFHAARRHCSSLGTGALRGEIWGPVVQSKSVLAFQTDAAKDGSWRFRNTSSGKVFAGPGPEGVSLRLSKLARLRAHL